MKEMVGGCCVCSDERGWPDNPLVYCDGNGCTVAVHQACYGIVTVPTGPWFCRKCESPETKGKVRCELCPSRSGALKRTDTGGWAHVVCALYIPEVRFGNVTSMEPIVLRLIPPERYNKTCYICQDLGKPHRASAGACMQCNKSGCKQQFHVTCAQSLGLLCEEAGNYLDNVKYCGYCQHHYSKLKKGGNVKTIPPYKPVPHDSHSSDSSGEKEGEGSPHAAGGSTPTHAKSKGPGRKSSHGGGKSTPGSSKQQPAPQPMDKKKSPNRRGSSAGDGGGSKGNTPAPSPQHNTEQTVPAKGNVTPTAVNKGSPQAASPTVKPPAEPVGVISSVASASAAAAASTITNTTNSVATSVVQAPKPLFHESVITNTDAMDTKHTKKRKAAAAAQAAAAQAAAAAAAAVATAAANANAASAEFAGNPPMAGSNASPARATQTWDQRDEMQEPAEKVIKRAKTDHEPSPAHFASMSAAPPPPPPPPPAPAHSPSQPSPRHLTSPMAGPSGMNPPPSNIRSPSQHQRARHERDGQASLLVSVPLPSTSYGLNLSTHSQGAQVSQASDLSMSPHIFHPPQQKQATIETNHPGHPPHGHPQRSAWGGLNVQYEQQHIPQDPNKPGVSGMSGGNRDPNSGMQMSQMSPMPPLPPSSNIRNKKRAAMSNAAAMANPPLPPPPAPMPPAAIRTKKRAAMSTITSMEPPPPPPLHMQMPSTSTQSLASVRRQPQPTPPPIYTETVKESPPSSPGERVMKKPEPKITHTAPHMLGNELNPDSGAAARLQEQLTAELAAHAAGSIGSDPLIPPPLLNKAAGSRSSNAQSLDQLLERQWEQGSQFLMEQAQHFDIASLLSCLHQLRTENVRLEEHVSNLLQRRDHLLAVNARLAIPLTAAPVPPPPPESQRCPRDNVGQIRPPPPPSRTETITSAHQSMAAEQRSHQLMMREVQQKPS